MSDWQDTTLGDLLLLQRGLDLPERLRRPGRYSVLGSNGPVGYHDEAPVRGPGVVIGRATNLGRPTYWAEDFWPLNTCLYVKDFRGSDPRFVYYLFESLDLSGFDSGSVQPMLNRNYVAMVPLRVPGLSEQRAIAGVLGALDDKIESNYRIAEACELLSVALIEGSFASGVERRTVGEVAEFHDRLRKPLSSLERSEMRGPRVYPYYGATGVFDYVDNYLFEGVTALVGEDGSVVNDDGTPVVQLAWGKYWVNNHAHVLVGTSVTTELLYVALRRSDVRPLVTGAVQAKVSMGNLRSLALDLPPQRLWEPLGLEVRDLLGRKRGAHDEIRALESLRDALLPELLSGRLRVRDAESVLEGAV